MIPADQLFTTATSINSPSFRAGFLAGIFEVAVLRS